MGAILSLMGGGGALLTVPILVYFFKISPTHAPLLSLVVIGFLSFVGSLRNVFNKSIHYLYAFLIAAPGALGIYFARTILLPKVPATLPVFSTGFIIQKSSLIMFLFVTIMFNAGRNMIWPPKKITNKSGKFGSRLNPKVYLVVSGFLIGILAGFSGAGGGFLIVPALVLAGGLDIKKAIVTSLFIMGIQSTAGVFLSLGPSRLYQELSILGPILLISLVGFGVGTRLRNQLSAEKLKSVFGYFVIAMATVISVMEIIKISKGALHAS